MMPLKLALTISLFAVLSACAGAPPPGAPPAAPRERPTTATANPALSAEEVSMRFLRLIEGLRSRGDITVERVQKTMGVTLQWNTGGLFHLQDLEGDWFYVLSMAFSEAGQKAKIALDFVNRMNRSADMSSICNPDFARYQAALKKMGYQETPLRDKSGQLTYITYSKGDILIGLVPQLKISREGKTYPACVRRIGL
ncbi:MAG: hypothetical protein LBE06_10695 [Azoarcus sp.]|jgi:hypothetical protein|nr:hypothetical protein [Azoarcus sp.]